MTKSTGRHSCIWSALSFLFSCSPTHNPPAFHVLTSVRLISSACFVAYRWQTAKQYGACTKMAARYKFTNPSAFKRIWQRCVVGLSSVWAALLGSMHTSPHLAHRYEQNPFST